MPVTFLFAERRTPREVTGTDRRDWKTQEIAELYRVRDRLADAGLGVELSTGSSDEGDPWAVFEQIDTGNVLVHIARIDGELVVANAATGTTYRGRDLRAIADAMLEGAPLALPRKGASNVVIHPRSVLTAFVAAAVVLAEVARSIEHAQASERTERDAGDTPSEEGFLALFGRLLNRDLGGPATFAGGVVFGAVAAAMLATNLGQLEDAVEEIATTAAATGIVADPSVAIRNGSATPRDSGSNGERPADTDTSTADERSLDADSIAPATLPEVRVAAAGVGSTDGGGPAVSGVDGHDVKATVLPHRKHDVDATAVATEDAAPTETVSQHVPETGPLPSSTPPDEAAPTEPQRGKGVIEVLVRKVADAITVVRLPEGFDLTVVHALAGGDEPIRVALSNGDGAIEYRTEGSRHLEIAFDGSSITTLDTGTGDETDRGDATGDDAETPILTAAPGAVSPVTATVAVGPVELAPPIPEPVAPPAPPVRTAPSNMVFHQGTAVSSQHEFRSGVVDVLLFTGREARISGFDFGEDVLVVGGGSNLVGWLRDVDVVGSDVRIVGANGSVIWLTDSYHTIA